jgi:ribosomal protein S18 acetylase RimI-like enzyme
MTAGHTIRRLEPGDARAYREIFLEAVAAHPAAFATSPEELAATPPAELEARLAAQVVLGGFAETDLNAVATLQRHMQRKRQHVAMLWGMYVRPAQQGSGLAQSLLTAAIERARSEVDQLELYVADNNERASRLYWRFGFQLYGRMPRSLRVDGRDYDAEMMVLFFR